MTTDWEPRAGGLIKWNGTGTIFLLVQYDLSSKYKSGTLGFLCFHIGTDGWRLLTLDKQIGESSGDPKSIKKHSTLLARLPNMRKVYEEMEKKP